MIIGPSTYYMIQATWSLKKNDHLTDNYLIQNHFLYTHFQEALLRSFSLFHWSTCYNRANLWAASHSSDCDWSNLTSLSTQSCPPLRKDLKLAKGCNWSDLIKCLYQPNSIFASLIFKTTTKWVSFLGLVTHYLPKHYRDIEISGNEQAKILNYTDTLKVPKEWINRSLSKGSESIIYLYIF